jgi:hypothetical protein
LTYRTIVMSDVEHREVQSATAFLLRIKRAANRLVLISLVSLTLLATLAWNGLLIFGAGRLIGLW